MSLTGEITFPGDGTYTIGLTADDTATVYIDDAPVVAATCCSTATGTSPSITATTRTRRVRIDYAESTVNAQLVVTWNGSGTGGTVAIPTSALKPNWPGHLVDDL